MERSKLLYKLKEFHVLEVFQVDLYSSQAKSLEEPHAQKAFERFTIKEQEHVDYYARKLIELGSSPSGMVAPAFAAAGFVTGKSLDLLSLRERYKLGISVENKAVEMYYSFIEMTSGDPGLKDLHEMLWYFMIDEENHQFWFKEKLFKLESAAGNRS